MTSDFGERKSIRLVIKIICILMIIASLAMIGDRIYDEYRRENQNDLLQQMYHGLLRPSAAAEESDEQPELDSEERTVHQDFAELYAANDDLVGWIEMGEEIALPIVYLDNVYYLEHDFFGEYDEAGTVFINEANTIWPADKNLLFHGHNMRSGAIFGDMDKFRDVEYVKQYPLISWRTIYDEEETYYVPVAIFDASMNSGNSAYFNIGKIRFDTDEAFLEFANSAIERSYFNLPADVQPEDELITLITCSYEYENSRFIIIARALRDDETPESVTTLMQEAVAR